jgi:hypothetical protein
MTTSTPNCACALARRTFRRRASRTRTLLDDAERRARLDPAAGSRSRATSSATARTPSPPTRWRASTRIAPSLPASIAGRSALRIFFYLPFEHSEAIADQDRTVDLCEALGDETCSSMRMRIAM